MPLIRLNKYLAQLGVASRRKIDEITIGHRITINGRLAILGDKVDPDIDVVVVDKKIIKPSASRQASLVYYALNKPKYVLSSASDDRGRKTVVDFVPNTPRVFPVGRLDFESSGLILLTNDGDLALRVTHPRYHLPKVYQVTVVGNLSSDKVHKMQTGVELDDGRTSPSHVEVMPSKFGQSIFKITLFEGKKRQIRRMCSALHLHVVDLHRLSIGPIEIKKLAPGEYRELTKEELTSIQS